VCSNATALDSKPAAEKFFRRLEKLLAQEKLSAIVRASFMKFPSAIFILAILGSLFISSQITRGTKS
jgi:hypothetical protein